MQDLPLDQVRNYLLGLQETICSRLEAIDGSARFGVDTCRYLA